MSMELMDLISNRIDTEQAAAQALHQRPHDYISLQHNVLLLELQQEIKLLTDMLANPATFKKNFLIRCALRGNDAHNCISLKINFATPSNKLYWDIAELAFSPLSMDEMLTILLPDNKYQLLISIPDIVPPYSNQKELREYIYNFEPCVTVKEGDYFDEAPIFENLGHFVFADDLVLDLRDIEKYPLGAHVHLSNTLSKTHPHLATKLYSHNNALIDLADDVRLFKDKGVSPKAAIEKLISQLIRGGKTLTGGEFVSNTTTNALDEFLRYFQNLPIEKQEQLRSMKYCSDKTLANIIDEELLQGECSETAAFHLTTLLEINHANQNLLSYTEMSAEEFHYLKTKYIYREQKNNVLPTQKGQLQVFELPEFILNKAISTIYTESIADVVNLIYSFHPSFYELLFKSINLKKPVLMFIHLGLLVNQGFFSEEQKIELAKSLSELFKKNLQLINFFDWSFLLANDAVFIKQAIADLPKEQRIEYVMKYDAKGYPLLFSVLNQPNILKEIIDLLPDSYKISAIKMPTKCGFTLLECALFYPETLRALLELIPKEQRIIEITRFTKKGYNLFYYAMAFNRIEEVLTQVPEEQRLTALSALNGDGLTILQTTSHLLKDYTKAVTEVVRLIPLHQRMDAIKLILFTNDNQFNAELIQTVFNLLADDQLINVLLMTDKEGRSFVHSIAADPVLLNTVLSFFSEDQRLPILSLINNSGDSVLGIAATNREALSVVQQLTMLSFQNLQNTRTLVLLNDQLQQAIAELTIASASNRSKDEELAKKMDQLAYDLNTKINAFYKDVACKKITQEDVLKFQYDFNQLLHSQDEYIQQHQDIWKPILTNILLVCVTLGLALIAISIKTTAAFIKAYNTDKSVALNACLFFAQTQRQEALNKIEAAFEESIAHHQLITV